MVRILIVDDTEVFREALREIFEDRGYTIVGEASNGAEAVEKFKELRPDITTLDITMPIMDGIEALKKIIELDPAARVIMLSSSAQKSRVSEAFVLGAYEFIPKPFNREKVIEVVSSIVSGIE